MLLSGETSSESPRSQNLTRRLWQKLDLQAASAGVSQHGCIRGRLGWGSGAVPEPQSPWPEEPKENTFLCCRARCWAVY